MILNLNKIVNVEVDSDDLLDNMDSETLFTYISDYLEDIDCAKEFLKYIEDKAINNLKFVLNEDMLHK